MPRPVVFFWSAFLRCQSRRRSLKGDRPLVLTILALARNWLVFLQGRSMTTRSSSNHGSDLQEGIITICRWMGLAFASWSGIWNGGFSDILFAEATFPGPRRTQPRDAQVNAVQDTSSNYIRNRNADYATLLGPLVSEVFSTFTLISLGLASAFIARRIFSTPFS